MRKIKMFLSLVLIVALSFSMMIFNAFAEEATLYGKNDTEVSLSTTTYSIKSTTKEQILHSNHYIMKGSSMMALFEVNLPALEEGQTFRDVNLYYKISPNYSVEIFKAGSDAANWTKFADAATIMNDYDKYGIKNCVTNSDGWSIADVTAYANELALAKQPKMYVALTVPSGAVQLLLGSSGAYTRPYTKAIVHTPNGAETSGVKIAEYQAPTYEDRSCSTSTYSINGSSKAPVFNGQPLIRKHASEMALFEVTLPTLAEGQTLRDVNLYYKTVSGLTVQIFKAGSDAANWTKFADAATIMNDYDKYGIKDCVSKTDDGWYSADVTAYANELILAKEPKMYVAIAVPSGTERLSLGSSGAYTRPKTTANIKTTPVINYNELTSLTEVTAGASYVALSDVSNPLSKEGSVIILIAQYKNAEGRLELVSVSPFEAQTIASKTDSEIVSTIPVQVSSEATYVKAFIWGAADNDPLTASVSAQIVAAE